MTEQPRYYIRDDDDGIRYIPIDSRSPASWDENVFSDYEDALAEKIRRAENYLVELQSELVDMRANPDKYRPFLQMTERQQERDDPDGDKIAAEYQH